MQLGDIKKLAPCIRLWDDKVTGLYAYKNLLGSVTFYLNFRTRERKQRNMKLGRLGTLTLESARKMALDFLAQVARGEDPVRRWELKKSEMTVQELMIEALKGYWNTPRFIESRQFKNVLGAVKRDFRPINRYKLSELNLRILDRWHKSYREKPSHGNHVLAYLTTAINWAIKSGITDIKNPCQAVKKFPKVKRNRYATEDEIKKIGAFLEENFEKEPLQSIYLYLILTTGTRPGAIERFRWKNLIIKRDAVGNEIGIVSFYGKSTAKTGEDETVIIPPKTLNLIRRLPQTSEFIVPCKMPSKLWQKIKKMFNCPDLWARDLRRTYATVGLSSGVSLSQVGELLNHRCWDTTKIYAKLMMDQRINSAVKIANKIESIIEDENHGSMESSGLST